MLAETYKRNGEHSLYSKGDSMKVILLQAARMVGCCFLTYQNRVMQSYVKKDLNGFPVNKPL